jgi:hypothetical protein
MKASSRDPLAAAGLVGDRLRREAISSSISVTGTMTIRE